MQLNQYGEIVAETYQWLSQRYPYLDLDEWIIMPNHFHGIMVLTDKPCRGDSRIASSRIVVKAIALFFNPIFNFYL